MLHRQRRDYRSGVLCILAFWMLARQGGIGARLGCVGVVIVVLSSSLLCCCSVAFVRRYDVLRRELFS